MGKLADRVALVTGGQRGLGAAILRELALEKAACVVNYPTDMDADEARSLVSELRGLHVPAMAIKADVADLHQVNDMISKIRGSFGRLDILVNNAGVNPLAGWEELDIEAFDRTLKVNVSGVFTCCRAVLAIMREQKKGLHRQYSVDLCLHWARQRGLYFE